MKPNESVKVSDFPGEPVSADPVEVLAYALWNDGKKDEAIAVLERQIALEKKLARGGTLPAPARRPEMTLFPLPESMKTPARAPRVPAKAANQNESQIPRELAAPERARPATRKSQALPAPLEPVTSWPRPGRRIALLSGVVLLLLGGAGLWASADQDELAVTSPAQQATTQDSAQPAPAGLVQPAQNGGPDEAQVAVPAEPVAAVPQPPPADLPGESEDLPAEELLTDEPPVEELPAEDPPAGELLAEEPPAEDLAPPELEAVVPDARVPRSRAEPPAPDVAQKPEPAPPPRATAPVRPAQPRQATREPAPRPATDSRSERSRRLAERREAAERYVARRRAAAERSAAAKRRGAAVVPDGQGPSILLGGRGLPN